MARCSICHTLIQPSDEVQACPECSQEFHRECWNELGGCATYGCGEAAEAQKPEQPEYQRGGWGDDKTCPKCGRQITASLLDCRCGALFPYADPMTRVEYYEWVESEASLRRARLGLLTLFIVSLFGLVAPITGAIAAVVVYRFKDRLAGAQGTYLAMGYGSIALGSLYSLMIVLLVLGI
jgi:hypothetical protein